MKRKKRRSQVVGPVWIFVDLFLLLCAAFLLTSEPEKKESNDTNMHTSPKIFVFLEEKGEGNYGIKLNGKQITKGRLSEIIRLAVKEKVHHVEVVAKVESQIPHGFVLDVKDVALSSGIVAENGEKVLKVVWDSQRLTSHSLNQ